MPRPPRRRGPAVLALAAVALTAATACATTVTGSPLADPAAAQDQPRPTSSAPGSSTTTESSSPTRAAPTSLSATPEPTSSGDEILVDAGLADDCLLPGPDVAAVVGVAEVYFENVTVGDAGDTDAPTSCFYTEEGDFVPRARIQVYTSAPATPAEVIAAQGGTPVAGVGEVATINDVEGDTLLWVGVGDRTAVLRLFTGNDGTRPPPPDPAALTALGVALAAALPTA